MPIVVTEPGNYSANPGETVVVNATATITLPAVANGISVTVVNGSTNVAAPVPVMVSAGSTSIYGLGCGTGVSAIPISAVGSAVTVTSDGTGWYIVAGTQDSGWQAVSPTQFINGWETFVGAEPTASYRLQANVVRYRGAVTGGTADQIATALPYRARGRQECVGATANTTTTYLAGFDTGGNLFALDITISSDLILFLDSITYTVD